jgi:hypothetical protein
MEKTSNAPAQLPRSRGRKPRGPRRELTESERVARVLVAFPWAKHLTETDRTRFAHEISEHPTDIPNHQLEAMLVQWKAAARAAERHAQKLRKAA